jgi:hypothetical protein
MLPFFFLCKKMDFFCWIIYFSLLYSVGYMSEIVNGFSFFLVAVIVNGK